MDRAKLKIAVAEAERFIERAKALPPEQPYDRHGMTLVHDYFPREQGAIKRASMDLTRALADLRRPS
jgi:hypothetical protein